VHAHSGEGPAVKPVTPNERSNGRPDVAGTAANIPAPSRMAGAAIPDLAAGLHKIALSADKAAAMAIPGDTFRFAGVAKLADLAGDRLSVGTAIADAMRFKLELPHLDASLGAGLSARLVEGWRDKLFAGIGAAQLDVVKSMSLSIVDTHLGAFASASINPSLIGSGLSKAITDIANSYVSGPGKLLRDSLIDAVRPAALAVTGSMLARIKESSEWEQRYEKALFDHGWWVPPSAPMDFFWEVGRLADEGRRRDLSKAMTAYARSPEFRSATRDWFDCEAFRGRRRFIQDGLDDHRRGRYRVAIPHLLAQLEGIAIDAFAPARPDRSPKAAIAMIAGSDDLMGDSMVETVTILWAKREFSAISPSSQTLNRHLILHGRSTGYATEANAAKVLFALDLLATVTSDYERRQQPAKRDAS
jgi:hypothetical protein